MARLAGVKSGTLGIAAIVALASGCATNKPKIPPGVIPTVEVGPAPKSDAWKAVATAADEDRISRLAQAWDSAIADVRGSTASSELRKEGVLLKPGAALQRPAPTPGSYNCRLITLGRVTRSAKAFESFKPFFCYVEVEGDLLTIVKQTGSQRPAGRLWEDDNPQRLIFLGSLALAEDSQPLAYGDNPKRDMAGVFERVGPFQWRLVIPWPQGPSKLDVFELTPVANQPK